MRERAATEADAVLGVRPRVVFEPASGEEAAEAMARAAAEGLALAFVGGGTDLGLGARPERLDAVIRTGGLSRLVAHAPGDQVVTVEAGMTLAALQAALAPQGQWLALDAPFPERATVGGIVAGNAFGPRRARFGGPRDLVLGVTLVRADGTEARGGGRVVKNVAGFDVPRLLVGSRGSLALITTITFRVHPLPETGATVRFAGLGPAQAWALAKAWRAAQLEPSAAAGLVDQGRLDLGVRFEGFTAGVEDQATRLEALGLTLGLPGARLDAAGAETFWRRHQAVREGGPLLAKLSAPADQLAPLVEGWLPMLLAGLAGGSALVYPTLGVAFAAGQPAAAADLAGAVERSRAGLLAAGGSLVICQAPDAVRGAFDPWGPAPPALELMRSLKQHFDPERRLSPGCFAGGL
jgi:glycolate oxidase FAD binding subunit